MFVYMCRIVSEDTLIRDLEESGDVSFARYGKGEIRSGK